MCPVLCGKTKVKSMKHLLLACMLALAALLPAGPAMADSGNTSNDSFNDAKRMLEKKVYYDHRITLYCQAAFDEKKRITLPDGFYTPKHEKRSHRVEWEHVVPAENFGRSFAEWREGSPECVHKGKAFKGRNCAEKVNKEYRYMQADMYNLYPAIGSVNALRSNYNFTMLGKNVPSTFGSCQMKIDGKRAEPPAEARGQIARSSKYMAAAYPARYRLSRQQQQLMDAWDKMYPVTQWECTRAKRIERLQGNENSFVKRPCQEKGMW